MSATKGVIASPCPVRGNEPADEITCCRCEDFVKALADETRQAILELLQTQEMSVGDIVGMIGSRRKVQTIFDHLRADAVSDEQLARVRAP